MKKPPPDGPGSGFKNAANCLIPYANCRNLVAAARRRCRGVVNRGRINHWPAVVGDTPRINNASRINNTLRIVSRINRAIGGVRWIVRIVAACFGPFGCREHHGRSDHRDQQATSD